MFLGLSAFKVILFFVFLGLIIGIFYYIKFFYFFLFLITINIFLYLIYYKYHDKYITSNQKINFYIYMY